MVGIFFVAVFGISDISDVGKSPPAYKKYGRTAEFFYAGAADLEDSFV